MELVKTDFPDTIIPEIRLSELIDFEAVRSMMESFYDITGIPMSIADLNGNILAGAGWQDICTKFHRKHPDALKNCISSDTNLTSDIPKGEFRLYRCRNGMWDMATPLFFGKHKTGNLFTGQFFFTDEEPDTNFFSEQAARFNFNEAEYLEALEKAPRLERSNVEKAKTFMLKLADTLAQLGYSKLKLEKALVDTQVLLTNLKRSKYLLEQAQLIANLGSWELDLSCNRLTWSDEVYRIFGISPMEFEPTYENFLARIHPDDREAVNRAYTDSLKSENDGYEIEHRIIRNNTGEIRWVHEKCRHFRNNSEEIVRSVGMIHDINERKKSENEIRESKEKLVFALEVASIGIWEWQVQEDRFHADERMLSMIGVKREHFRETLSEFVSCIHEEDISHFKKAITYSLRDGRPMERIIRIKSGKGKVRHLNVKALVYKDTKYKPTRMFGTCADITELKAG